MKQEFSVSVPVSVPLTVDEDGTHEWGEPYIDDSWLYEGWELWDANHEEWTGPQEGIDWWPAWDIKLGRVGGITLDLTSEEAGTLGSILQLEGLVDEGAPDYDTIARKLDEARKQK